MADDDNNDVDATTGHLEHLRSASAAAAATVGGGIARLVRRDASSGWGLACMASLQKVVFGERGDRPWFNVLLAFFPIALAAKYLGWNQSATFVFALLATVPFAERLGFVTECLADQTTEVVAALLNVTLGNLPELIIALFALHAGLLRVVQISLLGSIVSNLLLVMGTAFAVGGIKHSQLVFATPQTHTAAVVLLVAVAGMLLPAVLVATGTEALDGGRSALALSRVVAIVLLCAYAALLWFQLRTHAHLFADEDERVAEGGAAAPLLPAAEAGALSAPSTGGGGVLRDGAEDTAGEEAVERGGASVSRDEPPPLTLRESAAWLVVIAAGIALLSEVLVDSISAFALQTGVPDAFVAAILLPIAGNAAEHASAVMLAYKGRINIALGIAVGSSTQIALFVAPFCVLWAWAIGQPLTLDYAVFETVVVCITVMIAVVANLAGRSNYLLGVMLVLTYVIVAAAFAVHKA